MEILICH